MASELRLRPLSLDDEAVAAAAHAELALEGFTFLLERAGADEPWSAYVSLLDALSRGVQMPPGRVTATFLVAEAAGEWGARRFVTSWTTT